MPTSAKPQRIVWLCCKSEQTLKWHPNQENTDEFEVWWLTLSEAEQEDVTASVELLEQCGPNLRHPHSSGIQGTKHSHLRELRIQHRGKPYRVLYAFDPRRTAILLIGGNKTGNKDWYEKYVPVADRLYDQHLTTLTEEQSRKA